VGELVLRDLVKHYAGEGEVVRAVDGVSLTVAPGQLVGLYGPSGSGKTTLLTMVGSLLSPDSGTIMFDGRDITRMSAREGALYRRVEVGFVLQSFTLNLATSALNNAAGALPARGMTFRQARRIAAPWFDQLGIGDRLQQRAGSLSGGERQRVAIIRALAGKPKLLLADEPTASLDSTRSQELRQLLAGICHEEKIPGIIVTHDLAAREHVDRVYSLRDGRLTEGLRLDLDAASDSG
jgi:putative ABC transport system ATP-binding protein